MRIGCRLAMLLLAWLPAAVAYPCAGDGRTGYPAEWRKPVRKPDLAWWEIPPQAARPCAVILSKRGPLGILSNFAATPFTLDGERYASVEGFWQMMKYPEGPGDPRAVIPGFTWPHTRAEVAQMTAFAAKAAGDAGDAAMQKLGINYVTYKGRQLTYHTAERGDHFAAIVAAMRAKLQQNDEVRKILLSTGDLRLQPDHIQEPGASPAWRYYEIWESIRSELPR